MKIVATVSHCAQTGIDVYKDIHYSKVFCDDSTIGEIMEWAKKASRVDIIGISDIQLSSLVE